MFLYYLSYFFFALIALASISLHEYAHGWVAHRLGDPTPKNNGRLLFDPRKHIDILGTCILPLIFLCFSLPVLGKPLALGYAKAIPINPYHFKNPKKDILWVGLAGPAINFLVALLCASLVRLIPFVFLAEIFIGATVINLALALFNLLPIPPLDGSRILAAFLPYTMLRAYLKMKTFGSLLIFILIIAGFIEWGLLPPLRILLTLMGLPGLV
jgi:Zn-dependent protease